VFISVAEVKHKWGNLRTQFYKELSSLKKKQPSGSGVCDISLVKWRFFSHLAFLQSVATWKQDGTSNLMVPTRIFIIVICNYLQTGCQSTVATSQRWPCFFLWWI